MPFFNEDKLVALLSEVVAVECGVQIDVARRLRSAAALHDVGKSRIPVEILNKPGKLDKDEFEIMKTHTTEGAKMLECVQGELCVMARNIAEFHHERYDATGYHGKYTCDLPFYISIVSICDVFVSLMSERIYKHAWEPDEALEYISQQSGKMFNPALVSVFVPFIRQFNSAYEVLNQNEGRE
jgi:putative two-component system response regulator